MGESSLPDHDELIMRLSRDLVDSYDEELEMEIEDRHPLPARLPTRIAAEDRGYRRQYFRELFRLQARAREAAGLGGRHARRRS